MTDNPDRHATHEEIDRMEALTQAQELEKMAVRDNDEQQLLAFSRMMHAEHCTLVAARRGRSLYRVEPPLSDDLCSCGLVGRIRRAGFTPAQVNEAARQAER